MLLLLRFFSSKCRNILTHNISFQRIGSGQNWIPWPDGFKRQDIHQHHKLHSSSPPALPLYHQQNLRSRSMDRICDPCSAPDPATYMYIRTKANISFCCISYILPFGFTRKSAAFGRVFPSARRAQISLGA